MPPAGPQTGLHQGLAQQQTLSPQMRRSLEILQANSLELSQLIGQAMEANPVLEVEQFEETFEEETIPDAEHDLENLSEHDDTWRDDYITQQGSTDSGDAAERREFLYNSIVAPHTLQQHLLDQLNHSAVDDDKHMAAEFLIGSLDDRGFLEQPLEQLVPLAPYTFKQLQSAQSLLQGFDPAGIAVDDLTESLLLQLQLNGRGGSLEARIVDQHLEDLSHRKFSLIARSLGVSHEAVETAARRIRHLNPDPASRFDATTNPHVVADLEILTDEFGDYYAHLTGEHVPNLKISNHYKDLLARLNQNPKARKFLRENIHEARQIMQAVSQRQETLLKIGREIIDKQPDFLRHGPQKLRPMMMQDIAEKVGVHPATISRAVAGKYIRTPQGLMELRAFFSSGFTAANGAVISNTGIKDAIQQLINSEPPPKPLSDAALEKILEKKGLKVARRTIAKYREQLNILPSHMRKK